MGTLEEKFAKLRRFNAAVAQGDPVLNTESAELTRKVFSEVVTEGARSPEFIERSIELESIVLRRQRPVLAIHDNETVLEFEDEADSEIWKERLERAKPLLNQAIRAVGRIDLQGGRLEWVGTGWLIADNLLVTNRHVAVEFAMRRGEDVSFQIGSDGPIGANVDFLQELKNPKKLVFKLVRAVHIEASPGPDIAFFEVEMSAGNERLANPIKLAGEPIVTENVATIGYPAYDSRIPDRDLMEDIFGRAYDKKRLAPGGVVRVEPGRLLHNCTTLGGSSGSVVLDLNSGTALGLHFSGSFLTTNYAVRCDVMKKVLADVMAGRRRSRTEVRAAQGTRVEPITVDRLLQRSGGSAATVTIPLSVSVSVSVSVGIGRERPAASMRHRRLGFPPGDDLSADDVSFDDTEAVAEDYLDREGYQADFLGEHAVVDLPTVERGRGDVVEIETDGKTGIELKYEHFSVVMSHSRRMCFFSAVNINGNQSKKSTRVAWKWDPRLPKAGQVKNECYGDPPKFSRGHMTRREDPAWGDAATAKRGNEDSMHVTNATPQMQAFNSPIWLALEDYALQHAREDRMNISVFTGPYFDGDDPIMYGVQIPLAFWKIIAFIHDETGELCATGYEMTQVNSLQTEEEFVFGAFDSQQLGVATQVPIRAIEARSGINFGDLASIDPLAGVDESRAGSELWTPLRALEQIRFTR